MLLNGRRWGRSAPLRSSGLYSVPGGSPPAGRPRPRFLGLVRGGVGGAAWFGAAGPRARARPNCRRVPRPGMPALTTRPHARVAGWARTGPTTRHRSRRRLRASVCPPRYATRSRFRIGRRHRGRIAYLGGGGRPAVARKPNGAGAGDRSDRARRHPPYPVVGVGDQEAADHNAFVVVGDMAPQGRTRQLGQGKYTARSSLFGDIALHRRTRRRAVPSLYTEPAPPAQGAARSGAAAPRGRARPNCRRVPRPGMPALTTRQTTRPHARVAGRARTGPTTRPRSRKAPARVSSSRATCGARSLPHSACKEPPGRSGAVARMHPLPSPGATLTADHPPSAALPLQHRPIIDPRRSLYGHRPANDDLAAEADVALNRQPLALRQRRRPRRKPGLEVAQ
jgi:hypothetical protein